jgi:hypothetical protein
MFVVLSGFSVKRIENCHVSFAVFTGVSKKSALFLDVDGIY